MFGLRDKILCQASAFLGLGTLVDMTDPCMSCGCDRRESAPVQCRQPHSHVHGLEEWQRFTWTFVDHDLPADKPVPGAKPCYVVPCQPWPWEDGGKPVEWPVETLPDPEAPRV